MDISKDHIEVSDVLVQIVVPYLNSEHELFPLHCGDSVESRVVVVGSRKTGSDDDLIEGIKDFAVEGDQQQDDDANREQSTKNGTVLRFGPKPKQLCCVEKVQLIENLFQVAPAAHKYLNVLLIITSKKN